MIERRKLVEMWRSGNAAALATLVQVEGSSYRAHGARLLIGADHSHVGSISGGCLEAEIVRKASWLVRAGAHMERYSTLFDDTAEIPYGLGCGGTVDVLLEPAQTPECNALLEAMAASLAGQFQHVETFLPKGAAPLWRRIMAPDGTTRFCSEGEPMLGQARFAEALRPPQRLLIFGAGDDVQPLVRMASFLGWTTLVTDGRRQLARAARFPEAEQVYAGVDVLPLDMQHGDAVVLMTHSYEQDRAWLEQILPLRPRYLGLLGSRHRSALLIAEAAKSIGWELYEACAHMFSPVGLDLGGDGAEAVALSIAAELQSWIHGKIASSRPMTALEIEAQIEKGGASQYLQAQCAL